MRTDRDARFDRVTLNRWGWPVSSHRAFPPRGDRHGEGRHHQLHQRQTHRRRGDGGTPILEVGEQGGADALRLPDGHLLRLRFPGCARARSGTSGPAKSPPPRPETTSASDLRVGGCRHLRNRTLRNNDRNPEGSRKPDRPSLTGGHRADRPPNLTPSARRCSTPVAKMTPPTSAG